MQKTTTTMLMGKRIIFLLVFFSVAVFFSCKQKEEKKAEVARTQTLPDSVASCEKYWPAIRGTQRFLEENRNRAIKSGQEVYLKRSSGKYYLFVKRSATSTGFLVELDPSLPPKGNEPVCSLGLHKPAYHPYMPADLGKVRLIRYGVNCAAVSSGYEVIFTNPVVNEETHIYVSIKPIGSSKQNEDPIELEVKVPPEVGS